MLRKHVWKPIAGIIFLLVLAAVALFFYSLLVVDILIPVYFLIVTAVFLVLLALIAVLLYAGMKKKPGRFRRARRIIGVVLSVLVIVGCIVGSGMLMKLDRTKDQVSQNNDSYRAVMGVYVLSNDPAVSLQDTVYYSFGVLGSMDSINSRYAVDWIEEELKTEIYDVSVSDITAAAAALMAGDVKALAVNENYFSLLADMEAYSDFESKVRLLCEIKVPASFTTAYIADEQLDIPTPTPTPIPVVTPEPVVYGEDEPLIFYLSGIDRWGDEIVNSHSDVNILVAVNAHTKQILIISTPRDYYVLNPALGAEDKLTHCVFQGVDNSIKALELLYDIEVNNYIRVNYNGFVRLVMAMGDEITLDNPVAFRTNDNYFEAGEITLNGYQALDYARERHAFANGDLGRTANHVRILKALINKIKSSGVQLLFRYSEILDAMAGAVETDLTSSQMSDLVKVASQDLSGWDVKSYGVSGASGKRVTASGGSEPLYIIYPNYYTVDFAKDLLQRFLNDEFITDELLAQG